MEELIKKLEGYLFSDYVYQEAINDNIITEYKRLLNGTIQDTSTSFYFLNDLLLQCGALNTQVLHPEVKPFIGFMPTLLEDTFYVKHVAEDLRVVIHDKITHLDDEPIEHIRNKYKHLLTSNDSGLLLQHIIRRNRFMTIARGNQTYTMDVLTFNALNLTVDPYFKLTDESNHLELRVSHLNFDIDFIEQMLDRYRHKINDDTTFTLNLTGNRGGEIYLKGLINKLEIISSQIKSIKIDEYTAGNALLLANFYESKGIQVYGENTGVIHDDSLCRYVEIGNGFILKYPNQPISLDMIE